MNVLKCGILAVALSGFAGFASAASVDTIDASSGQADTYFVPTVGQETTSPYYRGNGDDWEWTHNAVADAATATSVELDISAYDVDESPCGLTSCEVDNIYGYDEDTSSWLLIGSLIGDNNAFSFTTFDLMTAAGGALLDEVVTGLSLMIEIDELNAGWLVSLSKSVITTDGANPGNPNPVVPLPAAGWMLIAGIGGLGALKRRKKS